MGMVPLSLWPPVMRMRSTAPAPFWLVLAKLAAAKSDFATAPARGARRKKRGRTVRDDTPQPSGLSFFLIFLANSGRIVGRCGIRGPRVDGASPGLHLAALEIFPQGRTQPPLAVYPRLVF